MTILLQVLQLMLWLIIIPGALGMVFVLHMPEAGKYKLLGIISGYIILWAIFQTIAVPFILKEMDFTWVVYVFGAVAAVLTVGGVIVTLLYSKKKAALKLVPDKRKIGKYQYLLWGIFALLLLFQLYRMAVLAFADGDDAYYLAASAITEESDTMYRKLAYTGGTTSLDTRHGLAPFPVWIAFLGRISGIHTAVLSHVIVPIILLLLAYAIYAAIGQILCRDKKELLPTYMIFVSLIILFSNYSFKSAETFLITRTSQGKAVLGSIIIPFMLLMLLIVLGRIQENRKIGFQPWLLLASGAAACCLCSTIGGVLIAILLGVTGLCTAISYKKWNILSGFAGCCLPALFYVIVYLLVQRA